MIGLLNQFGVHFLSGRLHISTTVACTLVTTILNGLAVFTNSCHVEGLVEKGNYLTSRILSLPLHIILLLLPTIYLLNDCYLAINEKTTLDAILADDEREVSFRV